MPRPIKTSDDLPIVFLCLWNVGTEQGNPKRCSLQFDDPDALYVHLSEDHIGRKALGTLQLTCDWIGCLHQGRAFSKRDNVVSHCRSHVHFRANICKDCGSQFKWPQDLKKHCLRQGHEYIVPESKGKPGPSPVYVVDAQDGSGPALVRFGPSLNGGRQKTYQRFPTGNAAVAKASTTTLSLTRDNDDESSDLSGSSSSSATLKKEDSDIKPEGPRLPAFASLLPAHASVGPPTLQRAVAAPPRPLAPKPQSSVSPVCPAQITFNHGHLQSQPPPQQHYGSHQVQEHFYPAPPHQPKNIHRYYEHHQQPGPFPYPQNLNYRPEHSGHHSSYHHNNNHGMYPRAPQPAEMQHYQPQPPTHYHPAPSVRTIHGPGSHQWGHYNPHPPSLPHPHSQDQWHHSFQFSRPHPEPYQTQSHHSYVAHRAQDQRNFNHQHVITPANTISPLSDKPSESPERQVPTHLRDCTLESTGFHFQTGGRSQVDLWS
ncbi:hypothetical protein BCR33DRAFT_724792 [Rhizoclosmatium globosum]|uniref:C2H2-type domain-containing protein n=1 Tax=Rhizoclosmatium globosum TaxID=329046 RepID=A0A1Y2B382_9FUNG|nr:hypothetical protein BCR33DRAFT_724792 [Rhizoclosmatium globosum]|eukprot:ORY29283.1 hypothetical protein BCR33DRAFT_724792 [Rhizoclosmatium globosum]